MDRGTFAAAVQETLEAIRESLAAIEDAAQGDESADLLSLSRQYALLVPAIREYQAADQAGRPLPRAFAQKVRAAHAELRPFADRIEGLGLHPSLQELEALADHADAVR